MAVKLLIICNPQGIDSMKVVEPQRTSRTLAQVDRDIRDLVTLGVTRGVMPQLDFLVCYTWI